MVEVTLPGGARTSVLGFGCSALVGGRTRAEARRLLDAAFDAGVRHFDVARVYGTGDAEKVLGEWAAGRRGEITIASKFGIEPAGGAAVGVAKGAVRALTKRSRRALAFARRHGGKTVKRGSFGPGRARASFEVSARELGTERLDAFFMHDCTAAEWARPELRAELEGLVAAGSIGCFGPATSAAEVTAILAAAEGAAPAIAQFGEAPAAADDGRPEPRDDTFFITHGVYRAGLAPLRERLTDPDQAAEWSRRLDLDLDSADALGDLLLAAALRRNRAGIVLVSSSSPARIARNAALAVAPPFAAEQLDAFAGLVAA